jgi:hypothetical protein
LLRAPSPLFHKQFNGESIAMHWTRDGGDWVLKLGRRKLGRVFPDSQYPGMWRSRRTDGRLSDMANLSWAKNAVLAAAERDIFSPAAERAFSPPKTQQKRTVLAA